MSGSPGSRPPICGVTVTYHPGRAWAGRLRAIVAETARTVIVDNGSGGDEREAVRHGAMESGSHLISNERNLGLAAALNQGVRWAFSQGFRFALLFDQDSAPGPGIAAELLRVHGLAESRAPIAVVGSNYFDDRQGCVRFPSVAGEVSGWLVWNTVIVSGSLVERETFERLGGFREEFFVDFVDHDYCLRARGAGFSVVLATRPLMVHSIGDVTVRRFLGRRVVTTNHSPERRYSMTRNLVILARRYWLKEPNWVARSLLDLARHALVMLAVEDRRSAKLRAIGRGVLHGLRGTIGPRSPG